MGKLLTSTGAEDLSKDKTESKNCNQKKNHEMNSVPWKSEIFEGHRNTTLSKWQSRENIFATNT